jgi:DNA-binding MarR family transcriptional regulator
MEAGMRPLGYWVKEIDRRIETDLESVLGEEGLTRRHWQVLHTVAQGSATRSDLNDALAPFAPTVRPEVDDLIGRGWIEDSADISGSGSRAPDKETRADLTLTSEGQAAHERVAEQVAAARARITAGFSEQDYVTLISLLERVAGNLAPG